MASSVSVFLLGLLTLAFMSAGNPSKVALLQPHIRELRIINEMSLHIGALSADGRYLSRCCLGK